MKVNYNYLPNEFKHTNKIFSEWKKLIRSTEFTLGHKIEEFEKKICKICRCKVLCVNK